MTHDDNQKPPTGDDESRYDNPVSEEPKTPASVHDQDHPAEFPDEPTIHDNPVAEEPEPSSAATTTRRIRNVQTWKGTPEPSPVPWNGLEDEKDAIGQIQVLQERFIFLTNLRITAARRYTITVGAIGALLYVAAQVPDAIPLSLVLTTLSLSSFVLLAMGRLTIAYDARARQHSKIVGRDVQDIAAHFSLIGREIEIKVPRIQKPNEMDADTLFVGHVFIANGVMLALFFASTVSLFFLEKIRVMEPTPRVCFVGIVAAIIVFSVGRSMSQKQWERHGDDYESKVKNWTPV